MSTTRTVISRTNKKVNRPLGSNIFISTEMVVYREKKSNGRSTSRTAHEQIKLR